MLGVVCLALLYASLPAAASAAAVRRPEAVMDAHWQLFKNAYAKRYRNEAEERSRRFVWEDHVALIASHNREHDMGLHSYTLGLNQFADVPNEQFAAMASDVKAGRASGFGSAFVAPSHVSPPPSIDWRSKGYVTPVADQGQCGSSWAFGAVGSLEGQHFRAKGQLVQLSVQNIIDCSTSEGNSGCSGGYMDYAFLYVQKNGGIDTEKSYPYTGQDDKCKFNKATIGATDKGYVDVKVGNETDLQVAVGTVGPVSNAIDATQPSFQLYKSGVYDEKKCSTTPNHGSLVVGYGAQGGKAFWIVKNSWGPTWGEQGYIRMSRNRGNQCGIASIASYPLV